MPDVEPLPVSVEIVPERFLERAVAEKPGELLPRDPLLAWYGAQLSHGPAIDCDHEARSAFGLAEEHVLHAASSHEIVVQVSAT